MSFFGGRKQKIKQVPTLTDEQQSFLSQLLGGLGGEGAGGAGYEAALQNLLGILRGDPESIAAFEAPTRRAFQEQTIPSILERFTREGAGARASSGLQQTLGQAGERLEETLGAQRATRQQSAVEQLLSNFLAQSQLGLGTRSFENIVQPGRPGFFQTLLGGLGGTLAGGGLQQAGQRLGQGLASQFPFLGGGGI